MVRIIEETYHHRIIEVKGVQYAQWRVNVNKWSFYFDSERTLPSH